MRLRDPCVLEPLLAHLQDEDEDVCECAASALAALGEVALDPLVAVLHDAQANVRLYATSALGAINDQRAVDPLLTLLDDPDIYVCAAAIAALGKLGDHRAVEPIMAVLHTPDTDLRDSAIEALGNLQDVRALPTLIAALALEAPEGDEDDNEDEAGDDATQSFDVSIPNWLRAEPEEEEDALVNSVAVEALIKFGEAALRPLKAAVDYSRRGWAYYELGKYALALADFEEADNYLAQGRVFETNQRMVSTITGGR
ncbi:HEAT repeat domain-containing protein [Candidatus Chloroploca sp. Khr17]|uniref:HEAT repeat domain-containing protein n=1 Tax=Candidatus Chloroploca sp. Khr17 TaxID=2496869 RepID=UPI0013EA4C2A|nr:HEAT repeat domain-containing protein [Candidatus Chloroploca sp. Khr17]